MMRTPFTMHHAYIMHTHRSLMDGAAHPSYNQRMRRCGMASNSLPRVLVVGGDDRFAILEICGAAVEAVPSSRNGGNGGVRRAKATILGGALDLVVVLVRWLGHSDSAAVNAACRTAGVPLLIVRGSSSAIKREVAAFLAGR
jgi:hypothetical protein